MYNEGKVCECSPRAIYPFSSDVISSLKNLTEFKKKLFWKYMQGIIKEGLYIEPPLFQIVCDIFNLDLSKKYLRKDNSYKTNVTMRQISAAVYEELEKISFINSFDKFERCTQILKEIFNLNDDCYYTLLTLILEQEEPFKTLKKYTVGSSTLAWTLVEADDYIKRNEIYKELYKRGLLQYSSSEDRMKLSPNIREAVDLTEGNSAEDMSKFLLGEMSPSDLKLSDFQHINYDKVLRILKNSKNSKGINILFVGKVGCGKSSLAKLLAKKAGLSMYSVSSEKEDFQEAKREDRLADLYQKQFITQKLKNTCILFDEAEDVLNYGYGEFGNSSKGFMNKLLEETNTPVIWTTNNIKIVDPAFLRRMTYCIQFEELNEEQRLQIWQKVLKKENMKISKAKLTELSSSYDIYPSIISNAVKTVKLINGTEDDFEDIIESTASLVTQKRKIKETKSKKLKEYDLSLVNADKCLENFTDKIINSGKLNFSICMSGQPGTGKSLYARYLADKLGLKIILKKGSDLLSMWVGGTEQNIARAFQEAKDRKAMLVIDEIDSFLQDRNKADHSWEVTEVNELLCQMEDFEYPFVCTTNFADSLDAASLRRFTFKLHFNYMKPEQVKKALKHFFNIENDWTMNGLTPGDFANVKKQTDFLDIKDEKEIIKMLKKEVEIKKDKNITSSVGF